MAMSPTLDVLAKSQNVKPMVDVQVLFGTWPDEDDDGFEELIDELRHPATEQSPGVTDLTTKRRPD